MLVLFWIFYAIPVILLNIPYVQQKMSSIASKELSEYLNVPVKVGNIDIEWFNNIILKDLYLEDQNKNVLLEANHVAAGFEALPLLKGKFVFTTVRLFGFSVNLAKNTPQSELNIQFLINAFSRKDSIKKETNIDLRFNSILISRGNFSYNVYSEQESPGKFNVNHIDIKNLSAKIALKAFNKDSLNANIKKMSFEEQSGFQMNKLSMNIMANKDSAQIKNFEIRLPKTSLKIQTAKIDLAKVDSIHKLTDDASIQLKIAPSMVCLKDFSAFVPAFKNFADDIELSADASGYINSIDLKQVRLAYSNKMEFLGKMELKGITRPEETYIFGEVNKMYITTDGISGIINNFSEKPVVLPKEIVRLGTINFTGEISGFFDNLVAFGALTSSIGTLKTDLIFGSNKEKNIAIYLKGNMESQGLAINKLFDEGNPLGRIKFKISLDTRRPVNGSFSGKINANIDEFDYRSYKYEHIALSGSFMKNGFNGKVEIDDPNARLFAQGEVLHQGKNSLFNFTARMSQVHLDNLNLTKKYESPELSAVINADFTGNNIDNLEGSIIVDSLSFQTTPRDFFLKQLKIEASGHSQERSLSVASDILNGEVKGAYSFTTIVPSLMNTFKSYLPALVNSRQIKKSSDPNNFSLLFTIENTEDLSETFKLPFTITSQARLVGHYNNLYDKFRIEAFLPKFNSGKSTFESGYLVADNPGNMANLQIKATNYNTKGLRNYIDLKLNAQDDRINTFVTWANNKERIFKADLSASTLFRTVQEDKKPPVLRTEIKLNPSLAIFNDSIWNIKPSDMVIEAGKITIHDFYAGHAGQYVKINGAVSQQASDTIYVALNDLELSYIFDILNIPVLRFGGKATGTFNINDLYGSRIMNTDLGIQDFSFNDVPLGRLNLYSEWDDEQKGILMLGTIYKNDSTWTDVNGYIFPVAPKSGLSLRFDANDLNIAFLHPFMEKVVSNLQGHGYGNVHLHGPFNELSVEGDVMVRNAGMGIDYLNTYYTFSDSIHLTKNAIQLKNATLYDKDGNRAKVNGTVNHTHFKNISFNANIQASNLLVYNATEKQNPQIFGTVYGSGTTSIRGNEKLINFDINLRSNPRSNLTLNFMDGSSAAEYDFIKFVDKNNPAPELVDSSLNAVKAIPLADTDGAELRMNFQLDMTPDTNIEMIIDPVSGDKIKANGSGSMQIQYGTKSDLRMYGGYTISSGTYNFSLQQVIHKTFKIREGSTISFRGDPFDANLNIDGIYNLTANLTDLDESFTQEVSRSNVPVNCVLNLNGMLRNPDISFDLELPNSSQELEQQVRSVVNAQDMMTRQIIYLLVLGKFYTPEYMTANTSDFAAVASSTISSQLSSALNSITDKVQIGTNIRTNNSSFDDTEVELLLSSQLLNNRLLFNGNFGYRNNTLQANNAFIGEFDLEYKLNKSGEIRLKAYNHYNDMNKLLIKQAPTTQGIGILFKKEFNRPGEIFKRKKKPISIIQSPEIIEEKTDTLHNISWKQ